MKLAFMFSGQGAQYLGMGKDLYENYECVKAVFETANKVLGYRIEEILFENEEKLNDTKYTQVAMFIMYQSILKILEEKNIEAEYAFGLSLGEYGALLYSGVFDFETGLKIVAERARVMELATKKHPGKMSAILGMDAEKLEKILKDIESYVKIANFNTYGQLVISGEEKAVLKANELALANGAKRVLLLNTSGAFHSDLMKSAEISFGDYLNKIKLNSPAKKVLVNLTGDYYNSNIKDVMSRQITSSVRFYQMVEKVLQDNVDAFIEIGPKKTLCSFVKKIDRNVKVFNIEDEGSLQDTLLGLEN